MSALTIEMPLPPQRLSPNRGLRGRKPGATREYREYRAHCTFAAKDARQRAGWAPAARVRVSLEFRTGRGPVWPDGLYRPKDESNAAAAFKAGYDALVIAGLFPDDCTAHMEAGRVTITKASPPCVIVTVERLEGES